MVKKAIRPSAFDQHRTVPRERLDGLDWPDLPDTASTGAHTAPYFAQDAFDGELHRMICALRPLHFTNTAPAEQNMSAS